MKIPVSWLEDYVDINVPVDELIYRLTMGGLKVENVVSSPEKITNVVVGEIMTLEPHPNADKLQFAKVNINQERPLTIITAATNIKVKDRIPVAQVGAHLATGVDIKEVMLRGMPSYGMFCSAKELGIDLKDLPVEQQEGILVLSPESPLGEDVVKLLKLNDTVIEFEIAANRPDFLSVAGIALQISAILGTNVKFPDLPMVTSVKSRFPFSLEVLDIEACPRYIGRLICGVKIKPSPLWLQLRLQKAGIRPINNVVDATNYVMLELGNPLHAFDYNLLAGSRVIVRKAAEGEGITTLDSVEHTLTDQMLVIADEGKAVAVAGIMGSSNSEINDKTTNVLLEAAYFEPIGIRRTAQKLGIRTDSSLRFEKNLDFYNVEDASYRACQMIIALAGGQLDEVIYEKAAFPPKVREINLRYSRVSKLLGIELSLVEILNYLNRLTFKLTPFDDFVKVEIPSYRHDLQEEADLIEEIACLYGYQNIPQTLPVATTTIGGEEHSFAILQKARELLVRAGLFEVLGLSLGDEKDYRLFTDALCHIVNAFTEERSYLRPSLLPSMLEVARRNFQAGNRQLAIFEAGHIFISSQESFVLEKSYLAGLLTKEQARLKKAEEIDFYYVKGIIEELLADFGIHAEFQRGSYQYTHPGKTADVLVNGQVIGSIGEIHPNVIEHYELRDGLLYFELDFGLLLKHINLKKTFVSLPRYPSAARDLAIVVSESVTAAEITGLITQEGGKYLEEVTLFDMYRGEQISKGYKSLAFSLRYRSPDKTLTDEEVNDVHNKIVRHLEATYQVVVRV